MKKLMAMLLATVLCVGALTACGGEAPKNNDKEVLVVGTNAEFPPFEYVGDDGQPEGFDMDLIKAVGEKLGVEIQIDNMEFDALVGAIGTKIDVAIAGITVDGERGKLVDFSDTYFEAVQSVIVPADSDIKTVADLENKAIGCQLGTTGNYKADEIAGASVQAYNKGIDAVNDLLNGRLDAVIIDTNPAEVFVEKNEGKLIAIDGTEFDFLPEYYAIAMPKGNEDLQTKINTALAELKADGTVDKLIAEYGLMAE